MAKNAIYTLAFRRKREGKTNYKKRLEFLKSTKSRLVIRRSNSAVSIQFVNYDPDGDKVVVTLHSSKLESFGWKFSKKSLPACYLAGLAAGVAASKKGVKDAILDIGLQTPKKGSRIYAALKGVIDAGVTVPSSEEIFPSKERLSGKHIVDYRDSAKTLPKTFEDVKKKILS